MYELFLKLLDNLASEPQLLFLLAIEGMNHYFKRGAVDMGKELMKMKSLHAPQATVIIGMAFLRSLPSVLIASTLFL